MGKLTYDEAVRIAHAQYAEVKRKKLVEFLETAVHFSYSRENLCLLMVQRPDATNLMTETEWRDTGTRIKAGEVPISLTISQGKKVMLFYDISQTDKQAETFPHPDLSLAYDALVQTIDGEPTPIEDGNKRLAYYAEREKRWYVHAKANLVDRFYGIISDILSRQLQSTEAVNTLLTNDMAAYILCRKYGVENMQPRIRPEEMQKMLASLNERTQDESIEKALKLVRGKIFLTMDAHYTGREQEWKMELRQQREQEMQIEQEKKAEEEKRIRILAEEMAQKLVREKTSKGIFQKWKKGGTG